MHEDNNATLHNSPFVVPQAYGVIVHSSLFYCSGARLSSTVVHPSRRHLSALLSAARLASLATWVSTNRPSLASHSSAATVDEKKLTRCALHMIAKQLSYARQVNQLQGRERVGRNEREKTWVQTRTEWMLPLCLIDFGQSKQL